MEQMISPHITKALLLQRILHHLSTSCFSNYRQILDDIEMINRLSDIAFESKMRSDSEFSKKILELWNHYSH